MDPGDDHELRLLHARRRHLLSERRGLRAGWREHEYQWIVARIDALEMGLPEMRQTLIWRLRMRGMDMLLAQIRQQ